MATDIYLTLSQLNTLYQSLTLSMLGMDEAVAAWQAYLDDPVGDPPVNPYYSVRLSWPTDGAPAWKLVENICFLQIIEVDDIFNRLRDTAWDGLTETLETSYTRILSCKWTFYGPNSYDNALTIRDKVFLPQYHDILAAQSIYLIPDIRAPLRMPELFASQWWERTDLVIHFNSLVTRNSILYAIKSAEVSVTTETPYTVTVEEDGEGHNLITENSYYITTEDGLSIIV